MFGRGPGMELSVDQAASISGTHLPLPVSTGIKLHVFLPALNVETLRRDEGWKVFGNAPLGVQ